MKNLKQVIKDNEETIKVKSYSFLKRNGFVIAAVILALLLLRQCNVSDRMEAEVKREHNNLLLKQNSKKIYLYCLDSLYFR